MNEDDPITQLSEDQDMPDNRPNNRELDPNDDLLTDDALTDDSDPVQPGEDDADASSEDDKAEQTDNSGEAESDVGGDAPQGAGDVVDDDTETDDGEPDGE